MREERIWTYWQITEPLARLYLTDPLAVATICDKALDKSGAMLGDVRNMARSLSAAQ